MFYRLVQNHIAGQLGQVFQPDQLSTFKHFDRVLLEPVEDKSEYPYLFTINNRNEPKVEFLFEDIFQLMTLLNGNKLIDQWVTFGFMAAAQEKRKYRFAADDFTITLECNGYNN